MTHVPKGKTCTALNQAIPTLNILVKYKKDTYLKIIITTLFIIGKKIDTPILICPSLPD